MITLTNLYLAIKKLFDAGLFNADIDARIAVAGAGGGANGTVHNLGDVNGSVTLHWDAYENGDTIKFNATDDVSISFANTLAAGKTKDLFFLATRTTGSNANLNLPSSIGWSGYEAPALYDVLTARFAVKAINDTGISYEGDKGAVFLSVEGDGNNLTFNPNDTHSDLILSSGNRVISHAEGTDYVMHHSRAFGAINETSGDFQISLLVQNDTPSFSFEFGLFSLIAPLSEHSGDYYTMYTRAVNCATYYYARSGLLSEDVTVDGSITMSPNTARDESFVVTMFYKSATGKGWFFIDGNNISGANNDPETDTNPHFTVTPNVLRKIGVAQQERNSTVDIDTYKLLTALESNASVNAHPSFPYLKA